MSNWPPGGFNWTQRPNVGDGLADRMNRTIAFSVPADDFDRMYDLLDGNPEVAQHELDSLVGGDRRSEYEQAEIGSSFRVRPADVGRGAGGIGIVIEFLFEIGDKLVIGVESARLVHATHQRITRANGARPAITLGVAEQLAGDSLGTRLGVPEGTEFDLIGSGDLNSRSQDRAFTGDDAFWVVLGDGDRLHHHHVTAYGEVYYAGSSPLIGDPEP